MISLKKYIDSTDNGDAAAEDLPAPLTADPASSSRAPDPPDAPGSDNVLLAYQAALAAMGASGQRAVPVLGPMIHSSLTRISDSLTRSASPESVRASRNKVDEELGIWADKAQQHQKDTEQAIRDLLVVVAEAAESTGNRDEKFGREIAKLCDQLRAVAGMEHLPSIRHSITENARALSTCVMRMAEEGRESIRRLTSEIAEYQTRLLASERRALVDPLTGLCNRRGFEQQMEARVSGGQPFSVLVADLNGFKTANDRYGHLVGDEILRQFAVEFKGQFRPGDTLARWGGDEFAAIVAGAPQEGAARASAVRHWVVGDYKIRIAERTTTVAVDAAIGTAVWDGRETGLELFARADKEMYRAKQASRTAG